MSEGCEMYLDLMLVASRWPEIGAAKQADFLADTKTAAEMAGATPAEWQSFVDEFLRIAEGAGHA